MEKYENYVGKVVRHFKGNYYFIENVCLDSEEKKPMFIYRPLYKRQDSNLWVRPVSMFFEEIGERLDNVTGQKQRFEVIEELSRDYLQKGLSKVK